MIPDYYRERLEGLLPRFIQWDDEEFSPRAAYQVLRLAAEGVEEPPPSFQRRKQYIGASWGQIFMELHRSVQ